MVGVLPSAFVLGLAAVGALAVTLARPSPAELREERSAASGALAVAVVFQGVHFVEEAWTQLPTRLGTLLGLPSMSFRFFLAFNVAWLGIWIASVPGLRARRRPAFFAAWFMVIAGIFNGLAHPLMALASWAYFPGLITSPLLGLVAVRLLLSLGRATRPRQGE